MAKSPRVNVVTEVDVDLYVDDILDGLDDEDLRKLAELSDTVGEAIQRRHYSEHDGPGWLCKDAVCEAWEGNR